MNVRFPSNFKLDNLSRLQTLSLQALGTQDRDIVLDLTSVIIFTPFSACFLALLIDKLIATGKRIDVISPRRPAPAHQVGYLGLKSYFGMGPAPASSSVPTVPLVRRTETDYDVAEQVTKMVNEKHEMPSNFRYLLQWSLKELLQNSFEHAQASAGVYVCAYAVKPKRLVRLCVLDTGIGVLRHITRNPQFRALRKDSEALSIAVEKGVTGVRDRTRGLGLFTVFRTLCDAGGEMQIASGDALMTIKSPEDKKFDNVNPRFEGTVANVSFTTDGTYRFSLDDYEE